MTGKQTKATSQAESAQEVERIRDIIFGTQMRDYDQQFQTMQRDLERLEQEIDRLNEQLVDQDDAHGKKLQSLRREMRKADDSLREVRSFMADETNTPQSLYLIMKTGGGSKREGLGRGIHWHGARNQKIDFPVKAMDLGVAKSGKRVRDSSQLGLRNARFVSEKHLPR